MERDLLEGAVLLVHIAAGTVAIAAGYAALVLRKGGARHKLAGNAFVASMLVMAVFAGVLGLARGQSGNAVAGAFTCYLVLTGWGAMRRPAGTVGRLETAGFAFGAALAAASVLGALLAASGARTDVPVPARFIFAAVAALAAALDVKVIRRGGLAGFQRLRRHLWRMCAAMFIATGSFFLGQADEIPRALHGPHLWALALAPLAALVWWMIRTRPRKRPARVAPAPA
ncbi:MAG TPA: hypothetical protein VF699_05210 [Caulobacteraceae bacterium]|jgi:hypothetical protein